ncbi:MAG: hypothetical protein KDD56_05200 [Bdellovibrionales bacterium]|nr:hypothetical protein [Bdellovibrionales bacterium]
MLSSNSHIPEDRDPLGTGQRSAFPVGYKLFELAKKLHALAEAGAFVEFGKSIVALRSAKKILAVLSFRKSDSTPNTLEQLLQKSAPTSLLIRIISGSSQQPLVESPFEFIDEALRNNDLARAGLLSNLIFDPVKRKDLKQSVRFLKRLRNERTKNHSKEDEMDHSKEDEKLKERAVWLVKKLSGVHPGLEVAALSTSVPGYFSDNCYFNILVAANEDDLIGAMLENGLDPSGVVTYLESKGYGEEAKVVKKNHSLLSYLARHKKYELISRFLSKGGKDLTYTEENESSCVHHLAGDLCQSLWQTVLGEVVEREEKNKRLKQALSGLELISKDHPEFASQVINHAYIKANALEEAILYFHPIEIITRLLDLGADPDFKYTINRSGEVSIVTPAILAADRLQLDVLMLLQERGADINRDPEIFAQVVTSMGLALVRAVENWAWDKLDESLDIIFQHREELGESLIEAVSNKYFRDEKLKLNTNYILELLVKFAPCCLIEKFIELGVPGFNPKGGFDAAEIKNYQEIIFKLAAKVKNLSAGRYLKARFELSLANGKLGSEHTLTLDSSEKKRLEDTIKATLSVSSLLLSSIYLDQEKLDAILKTLEEIAAVQGCEFIAELINEQNKSTPSSILHLFARNGVAAVFGQRLIDLGAEVEISYSLGKRYHGLKEDEKVEHGITPLHTAFLFNSISFAAMLIRNGASRHAKTSLDVSVFDRAHIGFSAVVRQLEAPRDSRSRESILERIRQIIKAYEEFKDDLGEEFIKQVLTTEVNEELLDKLEKNGHYQINNFSYHDPLFVTLARFGSIELGQMLINLGAPNDKAVKYAAWYLMYANRIEHTKDEWKTKTENFRKALLTFAPEIFERKYFIRSGDRMIEKSGRELFYYSLDLISRKRRRGSAELAELWAKVQNPYVGYLFAKSMLELERKGYESSPAFLEFTPYIYAFGLWEAAKSLAQIVERKMYFGRPHRKHHPHEAEFLLLLNGMLNEKASRISGLVSAISSIHGYQIYGKRAIISEVDAKTVDSWSKTGLLSHGFLRQKVTSRGVYKIERSKRVLIAEPLLEQFGFAKIDCPEVQFNDNQANHELLHGSRFVLRPGSRNMVLTQYNEEGNPVYSPFDKKVLVVEQRACKILSYPEGTFICRNSSKVFGRKSMRYAAYFSHKGLGNGFTENDLVALTIEDIERDFLPAFCTKLNKDTSSVKKQIYLLDHSLSLNEAIAGWMFETRRNFAWQTMDGIEGEILYGGVNSPGFMNLVNYLDAYCQALERGDAEPGLALRFCNPYAALYTSYSFKFGGREFIELPVTKDTVEALRILGTPSDKTPGDLTNVQQNLEEWPELEKTWTFLQTGLLEQGELVLYLAGQEV